MTRIRSVVLRAVFVGSLACVLFVVGLPVEDGSLHVEIRDGATGKIVPAMVCVTSLEDHKWRTPPDGTEAPPFTTVRDFLDPKQWKPGDIGPVRLTNGEYGDNEKRSYVYEGKSEYPFWQEPAAYFVSQPFSIKVPPGKWRLAVARGLEYLPVFEEFQIAPGERRERTLALRRWVDMPREGWYSGDDHIHYRRTRPEYNEFLITWARAENLHVANILRTGTATETAYPQAGFGKSFRFQREDYVVVSGQEDPRSDQLGHTISLNITAPVRDTSRYHLYDVTFDAVHAQGGLTGYAHIGWQPSGDSILDTIRGKVDFFEILQFRRMDLVRYYDFLNLGLKIAASAGSDLPWGNSMGEVRVYAYTGPRFSADTWFDALKRGRTFVTNGPMLAFTVNDALPGEELKPAKNGVLHIRAHAWAPAEIGSPRLLEIVGNGRVVRSAESNRPDQSELHLEFNAPAGSSQWIAARVSSHNGAVAHSSPVYVYPDGERFWNRNDFPQLVDERLRALDALAHELRDPNLSAGYSPLEVAGLAERIEAARNGYKQLLPH